MTTPPEDTRLSVREKSRIAKRLHGRKRVGTEVHERYGWKAYATCKRCYAAVEIYWHKNIICVEPCQLHPKAMVLLKVRWLYYEELAPFSIEFPKAAARAERLIKERKCAAKSESKKEDR